jgi:hypothetical protein
MLRGIRIGDICRGLSHLKQCLAYPKHVWQPMAEEMADDVTLLMTIIERLILVDQLIEMDGHDAYRLRTDVHDPIYDVLAPSSTSVTLHSALYVPLHLNLGLDSNEFIGPLLSR